MKIYMIIVMFLLIGAFYIISEKNLALRNSDSLEKFGVYYTSWLGSIIENLGYLTGYVVKLDWLPMNVTSG